MLLIALGSLAAALLLSREDVPADVLRLEAELRATVHPDPPPRDLFRGTSEEETRALTPAQTVLRMDLGQVPDHLLLAVLLAGATGSQDPVDIALRLLQQARGDLWDLSRPALYAETAGVGDVARARVLAARELYRRAAVRQGLATMRIHSAQDAYRLFLPMAIDRGVEHMVAAYLGTQHHVLATRTLSTGTSQATMLDPIEILRPAIELRATAIILGHNHPSGDATPSINDVHGTEVIARAAQSVGIKILDHLVVTPTAYTSLAERGLLPEMKPWGLVVTR